MKRINEKVKDIVEVRKFLSLRDFSEDASATLSAYRFTDATSELMSKWLDRIAGLHTGQGGSLALAGYRGVGKSHFLAALGAIVGHPELRTKISEPHVATAAQALLRRRYPCLFVRRGTRSCLIEEFKAAVAKAFDVEESSLPDKAFDLVALSRSRAGDVPFLVLVDTALERATRVARDDGATLSEMAEAVNVAGGFIGVALDDDIAGADGSNAAIVRSFAIDYLDQEHLYKIVDSFVFPKNQQLRPVLHDVYEYFREVMPTFRWSEQRFSSLYPLHPAILDVAPFVRLHVNDFALLSFAAEAGERILGRPANSLIALDEVFDSAENELRKVEDLRDAFESYDRLNSEVVGKIPVMQRLQAKLILKALLILSLEGQGTTAGEISSGTLIFDENDPGKANKAVEDIVRMFAEAMPDDISVYAEEGREVRYGLKVGSNDGLKLTLEAKAAVVSEDRVAETLQRLFHERFSDSLFFASDGTSRNSCEATLAWRGGIRRGRVLWGDRSETGAANDDHREWEVVIETAQSEIPATAFRQDVPRAFWRTADLSPDERDALKRFYVLQNDLSIREEFAEHVRGAFHSHMLVLDRAVGRIFFEDGRMVMDGFDYNLSEEARSSTTLSGLFSAMLEPMFESKYPQHPSFRENLGLAELSSLVSDLYSGSKQKLGDVQHLAQTFALPLGLVKPSDGVYYPSNREQLLTLDLVRRIDAIVSASEGGSTDLKLVYDELRKPPYGLVREAQQLLLAAMVSQRMIEFVTSKGDRINQRSLDLRMIWDDIVGLARPEDSSYSIEKLAKWAQAFSGRTDIKDLGVDADLAKFREGAEQWIADWDKERVLGRFNEVPEESLNNVIWKAVTRASRTLGAATALLRKYIDGQTSVEECLGRVSETFLDDTARFESAKTDVETAKIFLDGRSERELAERYVLTAAATDDANVEFAREDVLKRLTAFASEPNIEKSREIGYAFSRFQSAFSSHYVEGHDSVMRSHSLQQQASEFLEGEEFWFYENLVDMVGPSTSVAVQLSAVKRLDCSAKTQELLAVSPRCACGYETTSRPRWETVVTDLAASVAVASHDLVDRLRAVLEPISEHMAELSGSASGDELASAISDVVKFVQTGAAPERWTADHARAFRLAHSRVKQTPANARIEKEPLLTEADIESAVMSLA